MSSDNGLIHRSDEEQKRSIEIYDSFRDELYKRQLSNTENYDKSILTLSSAGLAISLTFLRSVVPLESAEYLWLAKASWICFLVSIILSLIAYLISNAAISKQLSIAEDYYVNKIQSAFNQKNILSELNNMLNYAVGLLFGLAIIAIVIFVTLNLKQGDTKMSDKKIESSDFRPTLESATILNLQHVPVEGISTNSAEIPTMQAAPGETSQQSQVPQQSQSSESQPQESNSGE
ncbi:MAG: hypothetical protein JRG71_13725 [Deltaproteobacteria bacterium]|nr:hypothetical protein [Deltaproteobacteria bacterium]